MELFDQLKEKQAKIAVVGLGYVGLPLAVAFSSHFSVIGFDVDVSKIERYRLGCDPTREVGEEAVARSGIFFTSDESQLRQASFIVVAVPTPVNGDKTPDLSPVIGASRIVGRNLRPGAVVVYESTVYPGVTEEVCQPILEQESGLRCPDNFLLGYSPERINPGDRVHTLRTITKIVSGINEEALELIRNVYSCIVEAGTWPVSSIKTAEAVKLVENSQRDINIAFMNEMAMVFSRMGIDTNEVVDGMNTKWNALGFRPGLVGGHCIGVDPYYFVYEAAKLGYSSQIVSSGRKINDYMGTFVGDMAIRKMVMAGVRVPGAKVAILGITFKENCPDTRNTGVARIIHKLCEYGIDPMVVDPWADAAQVEREYGIHLMKMEDVKNVQCIIHAVDHIQFRQMGLEGIVSMLDPAGGKVLLDVKGIWPVSALKAQEVNWWRL